MKYDIIIPHYGATVQLEKLCRECLRSIARHSKDYRLIFIDNGSPAPTFRRILSEVKRHHPHIVIRNTENLGFVRAVNQGLRIADAEYVVIMNNDTEAVPQWLEVLTKAVELGPEVAAAGPKTTCKSWQGKTTWTGPPRIIPTTGMLAFFCTLFKREAMEKVGYLDEAFGVGLGDDSDYCKRIHQAGYRLAFAPDLVIPHKHRSTFNTVFGAAKVSELQDAAMKRYTEKWGA